VWATICNLRASQEVENSFSYLALLNIYPILFCLSIESRSIHVTSFKCVFETLDSGLS
jgi:hypothetical protein